MLINKLLIETNYIIVRTVELGSLKYFLDFGCIPIVRLNNSTGNSYRVCTLTYDSVRNDVGLSPNIQPLTVSNIKTLIETLKFYAQGQRLGRFAIRYLMLNEISIHLTGSRDTLWKK